MVDPDKRKKIERKILELRREIEDFLRVGDTREVERRRDSISDLEKKLCEGDGHVPEKDE
jgi:hypothetical protein